MRPQNPTTRFSNRVELYSKHRPTYPGELYAYLRSQAGLAKRARIADLGSGTGLLSRLFLDEGHRVFGVEPNADMRRAAEGHFAGEARFVSLDGRAEQIPLDDESVDFVVAGQAFHWFEPRAAKKEVARILRPGGQAALIWNNWQREFSPFLKAYEELLTDFGTDYREVRRQVKKNRRSIRDFFAPHEPRIATFANRQLLGMDGLRGRLLSSSYVPLKGDPGYSAMLARLKDIFEAHQEGGRVQFNYQTTVQHARVEA